MIVLRKTKTFKENFPEKTSLEKGKGNKTHKIPSKLGFVTLYHVTKVENLPSIRKEGLKTKYFKTREENKCLGIKDTGLIYLVKDKNKLVKPIRPGGRYALVTIKIPTDVYNKMEKIEGDPEWWIAQKVPNWNETKAESLRKAHPSKFGMISTEDIMKYSTPLDWGSPENCVCIKEDISPKYISLVEPK